MDITTKKIIITIVASLAVLALIAGIICAGFGIAMAVTNGKYKFIDYVQYPSDQTERTRLHFLNTSGSDAILIESNGRFGLVDAAEDSDNPRNLPALDAKGYEDRVVDYIKKTALVDGKPKLDFIIGTHAHSDHIGGVDTVINDADIDVTTLYLKRYYADRIRDYEIEKWDNQEVYDQAINAANDNGVAIVQDLDSLSITLGELTIDFHNGQEAQQGVKVGENENSLALLVTGSGKKIMLSGDMNNIDGDEERVGELVGNVDILKLGHHGLEDSNTPAYIKLLKPSLCIQTSAGWGVDYKTRNAVVYGLGSPIYATGKLNGIVVDITNGGMVLYKNIH